MAIETGPQPPAAAKTGSKSSNELAEERTALADRRTTLADQRNQLALSRTLVAHDRTLMAWVRTALSLISFGFTIYKFFQQLPKDLAAQAPARIMGSRGVALVLMGIGVGSLALATLEYRNQIQRLREQYKQYGPFQRSLTPVVAVVISSLGLLGFVLVIFNQ
jgi:putative membrane protein